MELMKMRGIGGLILLRFYLTKSLQLYMVTNLHLTIQHLAEPAH